MPLHQENVVLLHQENVGQFLKALRSSVLSLFHQGQPRCWLGDVASLDRVCSWHYCSDLALHEYDELKHCHYARWISWIGSVLHVWKSTVVQHIMYAVWRFCETLVLTPWLSWWTSDKTSVHFDCREYFCYIFRWNNQSLLTCLPLLVSTILFGYGGNLVTITCFHFWWALTEGLKAVTLTCFDDRG